MILEPKMMSLTDDDDSHLSQSNLVETNTVPDDEVSTEFLKKRKCKLI